eukprot:bmy_03383T0
MAAPMELFCWSGGWGLPSVDLDSLAVLELCLPFRPVMERSSQYHTRSSPTFEKSFVVSGSEKLLLESCRQQASCQLSVETLGAAPGLRLGLPSNPQWARDLDGQQAPRSRLPANSNRLLTGPRQGGLSEQSPTLYLCYTQRSVWVVPDRMPPSLRKCPWSPPASTSQWMFPPQKYNADYDLSARQGADTLAFMSLLEEKLLPVLIHTFWVDAKNYVEVTRKWYAEAMPFPLNFFLPGRMQRQYVERLQLLCGEHRPEEEEELEKELYQEARECLTLLSQRLGSQKFFFGDAPASLDAFVFSYLALLQQAKLPSGKLQAHLRGLHNLCAYCTHILSLYFPWEGAEVPPPRQTPANPETEEEPYRRRNQILSVLAGLAAMAGYALLSGIVSIQRAPPARAPRTRALGMAEEVEEE